MPRTSRTPPGAWIEAGLRALSTAGPEAVRVEVLARELGVTKGGFYNHFDDRSALLEEMLDTWEKRAVTEVIASVESGGGDSRAKLRRLFAIAASSGDLMPTELAIREWARRDRSVARRLRGVDNRRLEYMRGLFSDLFDDAEDVEVRCLLVFSLFMGARALTGDHKPYRRRDLVDRALELLLDSA
jgi:AcrR family transcriptional regulator